MQLDVGYKLYDTERLKVVYSFSSLLDYDPASSQLEDSVGEHYTIFEADSGEFLFGFRVRGQVSLGAPAFTAAEGVFPIPADVARLLIGRNRTPVRSTKALKPFDAVVEELFEWLKEVDPRIRTGVTLEEDLRNDLREMIVCLNANAYRGSLALAGVVLERLLKEFLAKREVQFEAGWMVGKLIGAVEGSGQYVDPALKNIWALINSQRIIGVHAKDRVPIPSRDQAIMVAFAVKDAISRMLPAPEQ